MTTDDFIKPANALVGRNFNRILNEGGQFVWNPCQQHMLRIFRTIRGVSFQLKRAHPSVPRGQIRLVYHTVLNSILPIREKRPNGLHAVQNRIFSFSLRSEKYIAYAIYFSEWYHPIRRWYSLTHCRIPAVKSTDNSSSTFHW